jgi:mannose-6-phosphate isomerase
VQRLDNPIRRYAWGSVEAIPALLGEPPDGQPQAELWIGAHPDSPSRLPDGRRLDHVVAADPEALLGPVVRTAHGDRLPYLVKVLAAARPLSLQVHPDAQRAAAGFADEEARGVPQDAPSRRYKDPFHKPEMVIALTDFEALCGWRDPTRTLEVLAGLQVVHPAWAHLRALLAGADPSDALRQAVSWLLDRRTGDATSLGEGPGAAGGTEGAPGTDGLVGAVAAAVRRSGAADPIAVEPLAAVTELAALHPDDPGVIVALLLNRVVLHRGEALHLQAGNIHAYLRGTALEVMATSDNVLRAGLTDKHVDVPELLRVVDWTPAPLPFVTPDLDRIWRRYLPDVTEFQLSWAALDDSDPWADVGGTGPRIVLSLDDGMELRTGRATLPLRSGESVLVGHAEGLAQVRGTGELVVVGVPGA